MTPAEKIAARLRRIVAEAKRAGLRIVANSGGTSVLVMSAEDFDGTDVRHKGISVKVHGGCDSGFCG